MRILILIPLMVIVPSIILPQTDGGGTQLIIKLNSIESIRSLYEEMGYVFDDEVTNSVRSEYQQKCFMQGSRAMGNHPRPIKFVGMAYHREDDKKTLLPFCHFIRPYEDQWAEELCETLDRPLIINKFNDMEIICGPKQ